MEIDYDKDFEKVRTELQTNFRWSNFDALPDNYRDLLNYTIKAVKNCSIHDVSVSFDEGYDLGYKDATSEACKVIAEKRLTTHLK